MAKTRGWRSRVGLVIFGILIASGIAFVGGLVSAIHCRYDPPARVMLLLGVPLGLSLLGCACLVMVASGPNARRPAVAALLLAACGAGFAICSDLSCLPVASGSILAAWICGLTAAWRAADLGGAAGIDPACAKCGYDLTGNVSGICPECGERI